MKKLLFLLFVLPFIGIAQDPCGTDEYNKPFIEKNPQLYQDIEDRIKQETLARKYGTHSTGPYPPVIIPIVIHIVYNDSINPDQNLPDSVIYQQIDVINRDFNLLNSDTSTLTDTLKQLPDDFKITFQLVTEDSLGNPHSGIIRVPTNKTYFGYWNNGVKFDSLGGSNPWDPKKYMNIWICDLGGGLLGYSQFPGGNDRTDGNVVDFAVVGNQLYPGLMVLPMQVEEYWCMKLVIG